MNTKDLELVFWYINTNRYKPLLGLLCAQLIDIKNYNDYKNDPAKYIVNAFEKILSNK